MELRQSRKTAFHPKPHSRQSKVALPKNSANTVFNNPTNILQTLCYADLFDYPLTQNELSTRLIDGKTTSFPKLKNPQDHFTNTGEYYYLQHREEIIALRRQRERSAQRKIKHSKRILTILSFIPTVLLIGISGSVAANNAKESDDIDIFIVAKKNSVWITRLFACLITDLFSKRRKRDSQNVRNLLCLNIFLDERKLHFPKEKQTLYTAVELSLLKVIISKNNTYSKLFQTNTWMKQYLPFFSPQQLITHKQSVLAKLLASCLTIVEPLARGLQKRVMQKPLGKEIISDTLLFFHPTDYSDKIMQQYQEKLQKYV